MRSSFLILAALFVLGAESANISCYSCISDMDEGCDSIDAEKGAPQYIKPCPPISVQFQNDELEAVGCRKIIQSVESVISTIRECAYTGSDVDGQRKSGNWAIHKTYYQCTNKDDNTPCNTVSGLGYYLTVFTAFLSAYFL